MKAARYILFFLTLVTITNVTIAQVAIRSSVDRNNILIGEPITVRLAGYFPLGVNINWKLPDTIPHFDYLERGKPDTIESIDGKKITQVLTITSFDSGQWELPPFVLVVNNQSYYSDSLMINVAFSAFDPSADYRDIKDIFDIAAADVSNIAWIVALATLLCIVITAYLLWRKKQKPAIIRRPAPSVGPYEEAMQALDVLKLNGWPSNGEVKIYYTSLNEILRRFIFRKLNISTVEKTNEELLQELRSLNIPSESYSGIVTALRMTDFVKFAKYQPQTEDNKNNFTIIQSAIRIVNNLS
jgi:hypothetical protein